jgi:putative endopeptidase
MRNYFLLLCVSLLTLACLAQDAPKASDSILDTIDQSQNPCSDFYAYACGNWLKNNEIPSDQSRWGSFNELAERNRAILRGILEKASADTPGRDAIDQKIGDFYGSCMDEKAVDAKGVTPLKPELDKIAAAQDKATLIEIIAHDHRMGSNSFFDFGSDADLHNASMDIAYVDQSGLTLPDRDYYLKDDAHMADMRKSLTTYVTELFKLSGQTDAQASDSAKTVLRIESELAKASMDRTERRDPKKLDHKMKVDAINTMAPDFYLQRYFAATGAPAFSQLNVTNPDFFKEVSEILKSESLASLKTYASLHVMTVAAPWLSQPFVTANFEYNKALTGQKEIRPRWKRCVAATDDALGEALGQRYVELTFGADGKARMLKMVAALEKALSEDIQNLDWMSPDTKKQAQVKLAAITNKIGYPDKWRDYSKLNIVRGDLLGNFQRANEFESNRQIAKIEKPVDRKEWGMTPPTVNAYYNPSINEIVFPAGILQPPFFDKNMDDAVNFGGIGLVIGHELTHGFDDEGRKFDAQGNLNDWWTAEDGKKFEERATCVANEYGNFTAIDDLKLNGRLTLGENTADNGGARIAFAALQATMANDPAIADKRIDGFTADQRYFLGFGRVWCMKQRPEIARMLVTVDPHSPGKYRVDGVVQNLPQFEKAFSCKTGDAMVSANACRVW